MVTLAELTRFTPDMGLTGEEADHRLVRRQDDPT
jgi:hypothetical protein